MKEPSVLLGRFRITALKEYLPYLLFYTKGGFGRHPSLIRENTRHLYNKSNNYLCQELGLKARRDLVFNWRLSLFLLRVWFIIW